VPPPNPDQIRVLLVDDHVMVREGLRILLQEETDIAIVGEAWDGEEAVAFADRLRPDVVIMDVNMPRLDGVEATRRIKAAFRSMAVVGISVNVSAEIEAAMRKSGADAFLSKEAAGQEICQTIKALGKAGV
jgi:DNA-binding NarL/FixJ family response regulator